MSYFSGITWTQAQKLIRSKNVFVVKHKDESIMKEEMEEEDLSRYVYRDAAYKVKAGDELCFPKSLSKEQVLSESS